MKNRCWETIYEIGGCKKGICPESSRKGSVMKKSDARFNNMAMSSFGNAIVLGSMGWCGEVRDAMSG